MEINVDELNSFFDNHTSVAMPYLISHGLSNGHQFKNARLETCVTEFRNLARWAPAIAEEIQRTSMISYNGCNIPMLKEIGTPNYFVYSPRDGKYMGEFKINATSGQKRPTES